MYAYCYERSYVTLSNMATQQLIHPRLKASGSWGGPGAIGRVSSRSSICQKQLTANRVACPAVARSVLSTAASGKGDGQTDSHAICAAYRN